MIAGCLEWQRNGLNPPEAVRVATAEYLEAEDATLAWIDEACDRDPQSTERTGTLWASWRSWAERAGEQIGSEKRFSQSLEKHGYSKTRTNAVRKFIGLRVRPEQVSPQWSDKECA